MKRKKISNDGFKNINPSQIVSIYTKRILARFGLQKIYKKDKKFAKPVCPSYPTEVVLIGSSLLHTRGLISIDETTATASIPSPRCS